MKYSRYIIIACGIALAACGNQANESNMQSQPPIAKSKTVSSGELWDTDLTFGIRPDPNATGMERGRQLYNQNCAICHAGGVGMAGTDSLIRRFKMEGETELDPILANRTDLNHDFVELVVRNGIKSMPYYRKTEVSDEDLKLISDYLTRNNPPEEQ